MSPVPCERDSTGLPQGENPKSSVFDNSSRSLRKPSTFKSDVIRDLHNIKTELHLKARHIGLGDAKADLMDQFFGTVIMFNCVFLGIEVQFTDESNVIDWPFWWANTCFLALFVVEIFLRIWHLGLGKFYSTFWGCFDTFVTVLGVIDVWIISFVSSEEDNPLSDITVLRVFRLFRLIRIVRLLRFRRELQLIVSTIGDAMRAVCWMGLFVFVVVYVGGIFCVSMLPVKDYSDDPRFNFYFGSLGRSLYSHFVLVTLEDWVDICDTVTELSGWHWALYFAIFIVITHFCLLNMVVAVITKKIMKLEIQEKRQDQRNHELQELRNCLVEIFKNADADMKAQLSKSELQRIWNDPRTQRVLDAFEINCSMPFEYTWDIIDWHGCHSVSFDEFLQACARLHGSRGKANFQMMLLQSDLNKSTLALRQEMNAARAKVDERVTQLEEVEVKNLEEALNDLWSTFLACQGTG